MDPSSSGEELIIKTRKPYTITKQRERWTEEEHNRFVEAIKLHGRAWQRIEEHIGTKTAVQIRSHAQKFFSKLEKEAQVKGVPVGQALDIDIPPPRPKRKPSNPYPRKSSVVIPVSQVVEKNGKGLISTPHCKQVLDLVKEPLQERSKEYQRLENSNKNQEDKSSEVSKKFQEHQCSVAFSANVNFTTAHVGLKRPCIIKERVASVKEDNGTNEVPHLEISKPLDVKSDGGRKGKDSTAALTTYEIRVSKNDPRDVPVDVVDRSIDTCTRSPTADISFQDPLFPPVGIGHGCPNLLGNSAASTYSEHPSDPSRPIHHSWSIPSPFITAHHNQDDHRTFLQMSSTFAALILSTLLQNPAAHAAASFAASCWPHASLEHSSGSPVCTQCGHVPSQIKSPQSTASIVAATVAAATAWWAAQGLLPLHSTLQPAFSRSAAPATAVPSINTGQASSSKTERVDNTSQNPTLQDQQLNLEHSEALQAQHLASKSNTVSSTDSEESGDTKLNGKDNVILEKDVIATEIHISDMTKVAKQIERSSSGSNTPSSSEVEADAQKNYEKGKGKPIEPKDGNTCGELGNCCRGMANMSESWKEVSEEGKLAFQELFFREVLPQSFSFAHGQQNEELEGNTNDTQKAGKIYGDAKLLDLNRKTCGLSDCNKVVEKDTEHVDDYGEGGLLTMELENGKLRTSWTGFTPYKRCSVEAKESRTKVSSTQGVEKSPKRTRLEGEAST